MPPPVSKNRFLVEIDGIRALVAIKATPGKFKNNLGKYQPGNKKRPSYFPGTSEAEEFTFSHARVINPVGYELMAWLKDGVEPKTLRFLTMDERGKGAAEIWECTDCLPTFFQPSEGDGSSADPATFDFGVQPDDVRMV